MPDRLIRITASTTFPLLEATAAGHDFAEDAEAVLDVTTPTTPPENETPDHVTVELELDNTDLTELSAHVDRVTLSADQARHLAGELTDAADRVDEPKS
ncbi:hypothetical protein SAMN05192561_12011 [Halopenitus malekzadehii]|uniref:Uncharacterized protein n=1 Tax=Halopenitus malekzadehii TaxID=1267564 RepID=A0A1H6JVY5_9EURY|nr:DUF6360 family protein [Halopenitus malekzadehii]SEH64797.1 hypothetical protein SAMN05192561_12011 [Halopenitus malekzadehii]